MSIRMLRNALLFSFLVIMLSVPQANALNLAVVDVDTILSKSKAAKSIKKQIDQKREKFLKNVKKEEDKLRKDQKAIEAKRAEMTKEDLLKKAQEFEKGRLKARKSIQEQKIKLDKAYALSMNKLTKVIFEVCQEIADERKIDLIITKQNIIVGNLSLDITQDVLARMNKKLPNLTVDVK